MTSTSKDVFTSRSDFLEKMRKNIDDIIKESIDLFRQHPREYHPFYLRVYKFIVLGQKSGYLPTEDDGAYDIWKEYDNLAEKEWRSIRGPFQGDPSPYALFIQKGKVFLNGKLVEMERDENERRNMFEELESGARRVWERWRTEDDTICSIGLEARLEFLKQCSSVTFPGDVVEMNSLWKKLLRNQFVTVAVKNSFPNDPMSPWTKALRHIHTLKLKKRERETLRVKKRRSLSYQRRMKSLRFSALWRSRKWKLCHTNWKTISHNIYHAMDKILISSSVPKCLDRQRPLAHKELHNLIKTPNKIERRNKSVSSKTDYPPLVKKPFKCRYCSDLLLSSRGEFRHVRSSHPQDFQEFLNAREKSKKDTLILPKRKYTPRGTCPQPRPVDRVICDLCGEEYYATFLARHKLLKHEPSRPLHVCPLCPSQFKKPIWLWNHFLTEHLNYDLLKLSREKGEAMGFLYGPGEGKKSCSRDGQTLICDSCNAHFATQLELKRHWKSFHEVGAYPCTLCGKSFNRIDNRADHMRRIHGGGLEEKHKCDTCQRKFQGIEKLWKHKVEKHGLATLEPPAGLPILQCRYCDEKMFQGMDGHMKKFHPGNWDDYKQWKKQELNKSNIITKANAGKWVCPHTDCDRSFERPMRVKVHIMESHRKLDHGLCQGAFLDVRKGQWDTWEFSCKICDNPSEVQLLFGGSWLRSVDEMMMHFFLSHVDIYSKLRGELDPEASLGEGVRLQAKEKLNALYTCMYCGLAEGGRLELQKHLELQHPEQCCTCPMEECDQVILSPEELVEHFKRKHNFGKDQFESGEGIKEYLRSRKLLEPESTSSKPKTVRQWSCPRCEEKFDVRSKVFPHVKDKHPDSYFPCPSKSCEVVRFTKRALVHHQLTRCGIASSKETGPSELGRMHNVPLSCEFCGREVVAGYLKTHFQTGHGLLEDSDWNCVVCDDKTVFRFRERGGWMVHMEEWHMYTEEKWKQLKVLAGRVHVKDLDRNSVQEYCDRRRKVSRATHGRKKTKTTKKSKQSVSTFRNKSKSKIKGDDLKPMRMLTRAKSARDGKVDRAH